MPDFKRTPPSSRFKKSEKRDFVLWAKAETRSDVLFLVNLCCIAKEVPKLLVLVLTVQLSLHKKCPHSI